jgi:hypothetical protein
MGKIKRRMEAKAYRKLKTIKKKVIFLSYLPLSIGFVKNFYVNELKSNNFDVEYWDISNIYNEGIVFDFEIDHPIVVKINTFSILKNKLSSLNKDQSKIISYITYNYKVIRLFRLLTTSNVKLGFFYIGQFPTPLVSSLTNRIFKSPFKYLNFNKIKSFFLNRISRISSFLKKHNYIKEYDFVFYSGESLASNFNCTTIPINFFDYDNYMLAKTKENSIIKYKYCVFLDEDFVSHPDLKLLGYKSINSFKYYSLINHFFDKIEKQFNIKVVIAASPKSNYLINPFNNRDIVKYKTNELVKYSEFVTTSASTSFSYGILYKKPIIFFSYNEFITNGSNYDILSKFYADVLGSTHYVIDDEINELNVNSVNDKKYEIYKYDYFTSKKSEFKLSSEIVINYLKNN